MANAPTAPASSPAMAWLFTAAGEWTTVPAPWEKGMSHQWLYHHAGRYVFRSEDDEDLAERNLAIEVQEIRGSDPTDPSALLIGELTGTRDAYFEGQSQFNCPPVLSFLIQGAPALMRLMADVRQAFQWHPALSRERHKRRQKTAADASFRRRADALAR